MTKIVKEYIERKIREGAQPKLDALRNARDKARRERFTEEEIRKIVYASPEYKAVEALVRKIGKEHGLEVKSSRYCGKYFMELVIDTTSSTVTAAENAVEKFETKIRTIIQDTFVEMELAKSKANVDEGITKAIAQLAKAK